MILTTTPTLEGQPIKQYLGIVTGETIIGANAIKDFMVLRSEERRVGKECRSRWSPYH